MSSHLPRYSLYHESHLDLATGMIASSFAPRPSHLQSLVAVCENNRDWS